MVQRFSYEHYGRYFDNCKGDFEHFAILFKHWVQVKIARLEKIFFFQLTRSVGNSDDACHKHSTIPNVVDNHFQRGSVTNRCDEHRGTARETGLAYKITSASY